MTVISVMAMIAMKTMRIIDVAPPWGGLLGPVWTAHAGRIPAELQLTSENTDDNS